jgi:hypothetical protein
MEIIKILMERDGLSIREASELVKELKAIVLNGDMDPEEALYELGLEPDYALDLIEF